MEKILLINDHMAFSGGGDAIIREEIVGLKEAGYEVYFLGINKGVGSEATDGFYYLIEKEPKIKMKYGKFFGSKKIYERIKQFINYVDPDMVRIHLISNYLGEVYSAVENIKVIQVLHGPNLFCASSWGNLKKNGEDCSLGIGIKCWVRHCVSLPVCFLYCILNIRLRKKIHKAIDVIQSPSEFLKRKAEGAGFKAVTVIPNCFRRDFYRIRPIYTKREPIILYAGALAEPKGIFYLPKMLLRIKKQINGVKLIICGRGKDEEKLKHEFKKLDLCGNVSFIGFVNKEELISIFKKAKVLVLPSIWAEVFAVVGLESLACGVPVVGTKIGGIPEWLKDGEVGYLIPPRSSEALADSVIELLIDEKKRELMAKRAREYAIEYFNPDLYIKRIIELMANRILLYK